jgi:hypothetical protein
MNRSCSLLFVGLDVHKASIAVATACGNATEPPPWPADIGTRIHLAN